MLRDCRGNTVDIGAFRYQRKMLEQERNQPQEAVLRKRHSFLHPCSVDDESISGGFSGLSIVPGDV